MEKGNDTFVVQVDYVRTANRDVGADAELTAMLAVAQILGGLNLEEAIRVAAWAAARWSAEP